METGRRKCKITNLALRFIFFLSAFPHFFRAYYDMYCIIFFSPPPLTVNHLPPTGKRQSVCQETIHQEHTDSDICHLGVFVLRKYMLAARGPPGNFPQHKVLCVFFFFNGKTSNSTPSLMVMTEIYDVRRTPPCHLWLPFENVSLSCWDEEN